LEMPFAADPEMRKRLVPKDKRQFTIPLCKRCCRVACIAVRRTTDRAEKYRQN
jgi:hypothetical protein